MSDINSDTIDAILENDELRERMIQHMPKAEVPEIVTITETPLGSTSAVITGDKVRFKHDQNDEVGEFTGGDSNLGLPPADRSGALQSRWHLPLSVRDLSASRRSARRESRHALRVRAMSDRPKLIATESVRIDGTWRQVEVYANTLALACNMAPKAAASKSGSARVRFGAIRVKVLPIV